MYMGSPVVSKEKMSYPAPSPSFGDMSHLLSESCTFFVTTIAFRPTLQQQRDDAERKGQVGRQKIFDGLLTRLAQEAAGS